MSPSNQNQKILIVTGSKNDMKIIKESGMSKILDDIGVSYSFAVISAHRNPDELKIFCEEAINGYPTRVFIAVAGMAAALPGAIASINRNNPVIGVALDSNFLSGLDALFSIIRMPPGVPVSSTGIGIPGLKNAAIYACQILALGDSEINANLSAYISNSYLPPVFGADIDELIGRLFPKERSV